MLWSLDAIAKPEFWTGTYGEFNPIWQQKVDSAQLKFKEERHPFIKEFFKLKLEEAECRLKNEKQWYEEEQVDE